MDQQAESCGKGKCDNPKREGHDVEGEGKFPSLVYPGLYRPLFCKIQGWVECSQVLKWSLLKKIKTNRKPCDYSRLDPQIRANPYVSLKKCNSCP